MKNILKVLFFSLFLLSLNLVFAHSAKATCGLTIGNNTISANCPIPADSTYGCDTSSGQGSTNDCVVDLTGGTTTVSAGVGGTTRLVAGSITLNGGTLALGSSAKEIIVGGGSNGSWVADGDGDGWASSFTIYNATAAGRTRYGLLKDTSTLDCDDAAFSEANSCYAYSQSAYWDYAYSQSSYWRYGYGQSAYWRYAYGQSAYWRYAYGQSAYWRYGYAQSYYAGCFTGDTKVLMADGTTKAIKDVRAGDVILSYDVETGKSNAETVSKLLVHPNTAGGYLVINDSLKITPNHLIYSPSRNAWLQAEGLRVGDSLLNSEGQSVSITSIDKVEGTNTVYNLGLPGPNHTFFTEGFLVHNHKVGLAN